MFLQYYQPIDNKHILFLSDKLIKAKNIWIVISKERTSRQSRNRSEIDQSLEQRRMCRLIKKKKKNISPEMKRQSTDNKGSIGAERVRDSSSFPSDAIQGAYFLFESQR